MKLYILSSVKKLEHNSGFIELISSDYREVFDRSSEGQFIHEITVDSSLQIVNAGKMAVKVN